MNSMLYSPDLALRLSSTREYLSNDSKENTEFYPEGLHGSANSYAIFVGPSYGAFNGTGERYSGGPNRPTSKWSRRVVGRGLGLNPFQDGSKARQDRWNRLLLACLLDAEAVAMLSALYNLDWGHYPNEKDVPKGDLNHGADTVVEYIKKAKPRLIIPLSKSVWGYLSDALKRGGCEVIREGVIEGHQSAVVRLSDGARLLDFETLMVRPFNHPSRHFLTKSKIEALAKGIEGFQRLTRR